MRFLRFACLVFFPARKSVKGRKFELFIRFKTENL